MRLALSLLLVLAACSATPADPVALLDGWRDAIGKQKSVRLDVKIDVEGKDPRKQTYAGVVHFSWMGGTPQWDVTAHVENRYRTTDYRSVSVQHDDYLSHSDLTLPPGKEFSSMGLNDAPWVGPLSVELSLAAKEYRPSGVFTGIDRKTVRLVEHDGDRYVFAAGGVPHSGGYTNGDVRLVVEVDDEDRVVRAERSTPSVDGQTERLTAVYSQWGTAPDVLRPPQEVVAKPKDVVAQRR
ncbi:hypothetical protein [Lentzea flaviverrucosa]|uniref:Lipoprotein LprG n=1 Tax=Lentzea flaviverrucosa TaxID=200379 RepID=A0A1H9VLL9_9PSEU|nr:hypothetical protein [Lentzea flaviverrucosa]RDI23800.1 hypothetical protein DFR72_110206 [Lentzea flaviverrucosa]SES22093.1 hypothetical protein SAMN05216195_110130 [Lentzea flaviverrucosa]